MMSKGVAREEFRGLILNPAILLKNLFFILHRFAKKIFYYLPPSPLISKPFIKFFFGKIPDDVHQNRKFLDPLFPPLTVPKCFIFIFFVENSLTKCQWISFLSQKLCFILFLINFLYKWKLKKKKKLFSKNI